MLGTELAQGQQPIIRAREPAGLAWPNPNKNGWEPAIAAGPGLAITTFHTKDTGVRYAIYDNSDPNDPAGWVFEETIDAAFGTGPHDPSIAYNPRSGEFMAAARTGDSVLTSLFEPDPSAPNGFGEFGAWYRRVGGGGQPAYDKPWIVAGEMTSTVQEYYITYWAPYGWLRSIDGGRCWSHDEMRDADSNEPITGTFCPQPAVDDAGRLYVAYIWLVDPQPPEVAEIRFLAGVDIDPADPNACSCDPNDPNDVIDPNIMGVKFRPLYWGMQGLPGGAPITEPILLTVPLNRHRCDFDLPGNFESKRVPQLASVPNDPNRLIIVYHDTKTVASSDVNVYLRVLTRNPWGWARGQRILVNNNDPTQHESDQFMPSVTVAGGHVHIIFYDDRNYIQGEKEPRPRFDVYYAWAPLDELNFQIDPDRNKKLFALPAEPALDWSLKKVDPHEYNGIAWYDNTVWTTYAGTWSGDGDPNDPNAPVNPAVISSNRIDWP